METYSGTIQVSGEAIDPDIRGRLREKMVRAVDLALDTIIRGLEGDSTLKPIQMKAAKLVVGYVPRIEHGAAPVTLVLPGIPRPAARIVEAEVQEMSEDQN